MHRQFTLGLAHVPALGGEDFFVSASNEQATRLINSWPDWPNPISIVAGPEGAGKTHLVNVWRARSSAACHDASAIEAAVAESLTHAGPVAIEDFDRAPINEHAAFHLLNLAREHRFDVLITARTPPGEWAISLPDLRSRLRSAALVNIGEPDEALLRAVLVKLFCDRQLSVTPETIDYLVRRMERSMAAAQALVEAIDRAALAERRAVTRALAAKVLSAVAAGTQPAGETR
jgi:chromosomal replication initiation ATPase DnaA